MVIDFHAHIGKDKKGEEHSVKELLERMDETGIEKSVVFPFNCSDHELIRESKIILEHSINNSRLIPFMRFNPNTITKEELQALLAMGFKGVKLHPSAQNFMPNNEKFFWIYEMIEKKRLPILFHSRMISGELGNPEHLLAVAKQFPNLKIIIGHFFGDLFSIIPKVKKYPNIYTETSIYARTLRIRNVVEQQGFTRILFGSDTPYDHPEVAIKKIKHSGLSEENINKILKGNALSIFES